MFLEDAKQTDIMAMFLYAFSTTPQTAIRKQDVRSKHGRFYIKLPNRSATERTGTLKAPVKYYRACQHMQL